MSIKDLKPNPNSHYKQGYFDGHNPKKYVGERPIIYRSSLELNFMIKMELSPLVLEWGSETIKIPYIMKEKDSKTGKMVLKQKTYNTDFYVKLKSGQKYIVEVKPSQQVPLNESQIKRNPTNYKNACKWKAAIDFCKLKGFEFKIVTEEILKSKIFN
jgi:hypothetical protein